MRRTTYLGLLLTTLFLLSCLDNRKMAQTDGPATYPVIQIPQKTVVGYTHYPASIEGMVNSGVRAKVPGYITEVLVDEGEKVQRGQALFRLETESLSQDADAAKANVQAAQVEVVKLRPLVEKNIISPIQLETAKAKLEQAKASYNSVRASIGYATIKSPVNGRVGSIAFREGALASPGDPTPLTTVSDVDKMFAFFSLNERDYLDFLQQGQGESLREKIDDFPPVELQLANGQLYEHKGSIETVAGQVDPSTGTVSFRALFPNPNGLLANGSSGRIRIPKTYENVPVVPESASYEQQGMVYVYSVQGDSLAVSRIIEVQDRVNHLIVVASGLKPGEKIVAQGVAKLRNNTPIRPKEVAFDSITQPLQPVFK